MALDRSEPDPQIVQKWFIDNPPVADGTFELALALGGTVSAGAYTAGVMDFLIEALDCWEAARGDPLVPQHRVLLKVITGTSGGGVNASIAARALNFAFPAVHQADALSRAGSGNPFYDTWVRDLTLDRFLETSDVASELVSLLNGRAIDNGAKNIISFTGNGVQERPWVAAPLRLILTLTNLAGIPYRLNLSGGGETFVDHADYIRLAVNYDDRPAPELRPDEFVLDFGQGTPGALDWDRFSEIAKGTAAFPAGFPPRELRRPGEHYRYRVVPRATAAAGKPAYIALTPDWGMMETSGALAGDGEYFFLAVDGGATNNEPIELARTALCGIIDSNPRDADRADRAVLLVDPFAGKAELGRQTAGTFVGNLGCLVGSVIQQTRYASRDILLAADSDVFSRFMLAPRDHRIASAGLGAFIGFACPAFMRYDYMLGRKNCRDFLRSEFVLGQGNLKVFGREWTVAQKARYASGAEPGFLPIIPLVGTAADEQPLDPWPEGKLDPKIYRDAIERRFRAILKCATPPTHWGRFGGWLGGQAGDDLVADKVIEAMRAYLKEAELE